MNGQITWSEAVTVIGFLVMVGGAVGGVWWSLWRRIEQVRASGAHELAGFKVEVAEKFVRFEHLDKIERRFIETETRMVASVGALTDRMDRLIDRMDAAQPRTRNRRPAE